MSQAETFFKLAQSIIKRPTEEFIDMDKLRSEFSRMSRQQLEANGSDTSKLTDQECCYLADYQMRDFLGLKQLS